MQHLHSQIIGTGSYLPPRVVSNVELESSLNTSDKWIQEKIGIQERRYADDGVGASDLALEASKKALEAAACQANEIDAIFFATSTPDFEAPGSGVLLQDKLGCQRIPAFDIRNTSPGFLFALELADQSIRSGKYETVLVVGSEVMSTSLDFSERGRLMSVIFGDGAGAFVLRASEGPHGILSTKLHSDGAHYNKLWCEAPASKYNPRLSQKMIEEGRIYPQMDGRFVFENAVKLMTLASEELLAQENISLADINAVIPHQANLRIIKAISDKLNCPIEKIIHNIERVGNTNSASIPIAFDEARRDGCLRENDLLLIMSFGSGFSWGAGLIRL